MANAAGQIFWPIKKATGGLSDGSRSGIPFSFQYSEFIDFKTDMDTMAVLPASTLDSTATIVDLPVWSVTNSGQTFLYGDTGHIYKRNAGNDYTDLKTVSSSAGQGLGIFQDTLWYTSSNSLGRYNPLSGSPVFTDSITTGLETDTEFHPVKAFVNHLCIGNGQYLATVDDAGIVVLKALTFLPQERVRCLTIWNNYLAIGTQFGSDMNSPYGNIYLWDGTSTTYNDVLACSGAVNALLNDNGVLTAWIGKQAQMFTYNGTPLLKIKDMPRLGLAELTVKPGAVGMWKNEVRFGTSAGTAPLTPKGIYTYGRQNKNLPKVMSYDYALSSGTKSGTTVDIGTFIQVSPSLALFSWREGSTIGIDRITTEAYATEADYESLVFDAQQPHLRRKPTMERLTLNSPLQSGEYVKFYLRKEGETGWTLLGQATYTANPNQTGFTWGCQTDVATGLQYNAKGLQHEKRLVWGGTGTTRPQISSTTLSLEQDPDISVISS